MVSALVGSLAVLTGAQTAAAVAYQRSQYQGAYAYSPAAALCLAHLIQLLALLLHWRGGSTTAVSDDVETELVIVKGTETATDTETEVDRDADAGLPSHRIHYLSPAQVQEQALDAQRHHWKALSSSQLFAAFGLALLYCASQHLTFRLFLLVQDGVALLASQSGAAVLAALLLWLTGHRAVGRVESSAALGLMAGLALIFSSLYAELSIPPLSFVSVILSGSVALSAVSSAWHAQLVTWLCSRGALHTFHTAVALSCAVLNFAAFWILRAVSSDTDKSSVLRLELGLGSEYSAAMAGVTVSIALCGVLDTHIYQHGDPVMRCIAWAVSAGVLLLLDTALRRSLSPILTLGDGIRASGVLTLLVTTLLYLHHWCRNCRSLPLSSSSVSLLASVPQFSLDGSPMRRDEPHRRSALCTAALLVFALVLSVAGAVVFLLIRGDSGLSGTFLAPASTMVHRHSERLQARLLYHKQRAGHSSPAQNTERALRSDERGYIAIIYSGEPRSFSRVFQSHLINLIAPSPYTVHLFLHANYNSRKQQNVQPDHSDVDAMNHTLAYHRHYVDLDGQQIDVFDTIKCFQFTDAGVPRAPVLDSPFNATLDYLKDKWGSSLDSALNAFHSLYRANEARRQYERQHNIRYQMVIRLRYDFLLRHNVWMSLFDIQPRIAFGAESRIALFNGSASRGEWPMDGVSQFVLHDMVYRSSFGQRGLALPHCDAYGGYNDQFAIAAPAVMDIYVNRGLNLTVMQAQRAKDPQWVFHVEKFLKVALESAGVPVRLLPMCYSLLRMQHTRADPSLLYSPTRCSFIYNNMEIGKQCCERHCLHIQLWQARMNAAIAQSINSTALYHFYQQLNGNGNNSWPAPTLRTYTQDAYLATLPAAWGLSAATSSYYFYHLYADLRMAIGCQRDRWADSLDPYAQHALPFLSTDESAAGPYRQSRVCLRP